MNKKYDTEVLKTKYEENPFVADGRFQVPMRKKLKKLDTAGPLSVSDGQGGEVKTAEIREVITVDNEQFIKLFVSNLNVFFDLKPTTMKLVTAVISELSDKKYINGDQIYLNYKTVCDYFEKHNSKAMAKTSYMLALAEMTEKGMIAPSNLPNLFYINPAIFFNGDRIRFVTEIRRKKSVMKELENAGQMNFLDDKS
jgi:hypothetical protein